mmetsp:Transcript_12807/g.28775  ORF Transcript_12807/g.28775 Transcript_12807/m.28775 type:complete len:296 (+) Transcript_12807:179-1066(+)
MQVEGVSQRQLKDFVEFPPRNQSKAEPLAKLMQTCLYSGKDILLVRHYAPPVPREEVLDVSAISGVVRVVGRADKQDDNPTGMARIRCLGFRLEGLAKVVFENIWVDAEGHGVSLYDDAQVELIDSVIHARGCGLQLFNVSRAILRRVEVTDSLKDGVRAWCGSTLAMEGCKVGRNVGHGLFVATSGDVIVDACTFTGNRECGIRVHGTKVTKRTCTAKECVCIGNRHGLKVDSGAGCAWWGGQISDNVRQDVKVEDASLIDSDLGIRRFCGIVIPDLFAPAAPSPGESPTRRQG